MASNALLLTNMQRAESAWGRDMPSWVRLLATACDAASQRAVADRLGRSSPYVSRLLNRNYAGSYEEAETIVRAAYGNEDVVCPLYGPIPLSSCIRNRRRKAAPRNQSHHQHAATCPSCPNNTDRAREED
jgi:DNA-binding transcriptional regulator YdaS (Cro superfamily)